MRQRRSYISEARFSSSDMDLQGFSTAPIGKAGTVYWTACPLSSTSLNRDYDVEADVVRRRMQVFAGIAHARVGSASALADLPRRPLYDRQVLTVVGALVGARRPDRTAPKKHLPRRAVDLVFDARRTFGCRSAHSGNECCYTAFMDHAWAAHTRETTAPIPYDTPHMATWRAAYRAAANYDRKIRMAIAASKRA
jgi:hypothetical protein